MHISFKQAALALAIAAAGTAQAAPATYEIENAHTFPKFEVSHNGFSFHTGMFTKTAGKIVLDLEARTGSMDITVDTSAISTGIAPMEKFLVTKEFFNVEQFPTMSYRSTAVRAEGDHFVVDGELSLHGVTKPVSLHLEVNGYLPQSPFGDTRVGFSASAEIDRREFDLHYNAPVEGGGVVLGHKVQIALEVEAIKRADA